MEYDLTTVLSESSLFDGFSYSEIEFFLDNHEYKIREYLNDELFALAGEPVNYLMVVVSGVLHAQMVSDSGKFILIDKIATARIIAPAMLYATRNRFPVNVISKSDTAVFFLHKESFLRAMLRDEKLLRNFIRTVSDINHFLSTKIHSLSLKSIRGKLAEYLLQESGKQGGSAQITLPLTRQELADKFAVARQALSRSLSRLEDDKLIVVEGKSIRILDRSRLGDVE